MILVDSCLKRHKMVVPAWNASKLDENARFVVFSPNFRVIGSEHMILVDSCLKRHSMVVPAWNASKLDENARFIVLFSEFQGNLGLNTWFCLALTTEMATPNRFQANFRGFLATYFGPERKTMALDDTLPLWCPLIPTHRRSRNKRKPDQK